LRQTVGRVGFYKTTLFITFLPPLFTTSTRMSGSAEAWRDVKVDPSRVRPRNMFDIMDMTYEQYVERHYAIMLKSHQEQLQMQQQQQQQQQMQMQMQMQMQQNQQQQQQQGAAVSGGAGYRR